MNLCQYAEQYAPLLVWRISFIPTESYKSCLYYAGQSPLPSYLGFTECVYHLYLATRDYIVRGMEREIDFIDLNYPIPNIRRVGGRECL